jgi:hypothetical protein
MLGRNIIILFSLGLFYSVMVLVNVSFADQLRFPVESDNELLGHFTYEISPNSWTSKLRKLLPYNNNYALEFRKNKNYEVVFLLHVETTFEDCKKEYEFCSDRIIAVLKVPEHASNEAINFNCRFKRGKLQSDDVVFGIVKNSKVPGYFSPRLAWLVKFETLTFEPVDGEGVECGLFGLD